MCWLDSDCSFISLSICFCMRESSTDLLVSVFFFFFLHVSNLHAAAVLCRSTGSAGTTLSDAGLCLGCWTLWSWLWFNRSQGSARSKLRPCFNISAASSSSATLLPASWSPSWVTLLLSRSTASSTNPQLLEPEDAPRDSTLYFTSDVWI